MIFFSAQLLVVMFDTGKTVDLACHQHELEQIAFDFGNQGGHPLDHLAGEILIILGQDDIVDMARDLLITLGAMRQETVHALDQLTEFRRRHLAAHETLPVGGKVLGLAGKVVEHRGACLRQVHGAVGRTFGERTT